MLRAGVSVCAEEGGGERLPAGVSQKCLQEELTGDNVRETHKWLRSLVGEEPAREGRG